MSNEVFNPYAGNLLIDKLPPIPDAQTILEHQNSLPQIPDNIVEYPSEIRLHYLQDLWDKFWIPSHTGSRVAESIDLMIRHGYKCRNVSDPKTWSIIFGSPSAPKVVSNNSSIAGSLVGIPGVGKSKLIAKALSYYPQVIKHTNFPNILNEHYQMVWQSVEVPGSGKSADFALELMRKWDESLRAQGNSIQLKFERTIASSNRDGGTMFDEWLQAAKSHFLGLLHLDEVQNFFDIPSLKQRQMAIKNEKIAPKIKDDKLLKNILNLTNSGLPILISGTPDGINFITSRLSTSQRISTFGYNELLRYESPDDREYQVFLNQLMKYQYVKTPLMDTDGLAGLLLQLTGGIKRLIISLWIEAHKCAYTRAQDNLLLEDFITAERINFKIIRPAIHAIESGNPKFITQYLDLLQKA